MKVQIAHFTYKIKFVKNPRSSDHPDIDLLGCCENQKQIIQIKKSQPHAQKIDTLLHELLHAVWYVAGLESFAGEEPEEAYVGVITPLLLQALTSNKKVWKMFNDKV